MITGTRSGRPAGVAHLLAVSGILCAQAARARGAARAIDAGADAEPLRRSAPLRWIGGGSGDTTDTRARIRSKLVGGMLPRADSVASITTWGTGRTCDGCDLAIAVGHRAVLATYLDGTVLRFHAVCFGAWEMERQTIPRPAA
jgi:hypothetical protein